MNNILYQIGSTCIVPIYVLYLYFNYFIQVLFKLDLNGGGLLVEQEKLHLAMGVQKDRFSMEKFRQMCILSGCDYLPSLPGIGLAKASRFIKRTAEPDIHKVRNVR